MSDEAKFTCILPTCSRPATHREPDANAVGGVIHWCDVHWPPGAEPIRPAGDEAKRIVAEETWHVEEQELEYYDLHDANGNELGNIYGPNLARIAACAPEALRMLLDNEWAGGGQPSGYCLDCGAPQSAQHSEHCPWLALMRKAGLR